MVPQGRSVLFKDLDKPVFAADVFSQYELEYLNENVRKSEWVGRENHIYLHYTDWSVFCAWLQVLNLRKLLEDEKFVFRIENEAGQYPLDFKERFGIDYSQYPVKPVGLREINKLIWHTQLSTHNGGDFFNEVLDAHPNLLTLTSVMFDSVEKTVTEVKKLRHAKGSREAREQLFNKKGLDTRVMQELRSIQEPSDKDIFTAVYLSDKTISQFLDPAARIVPGVFFQPHFHNIVYSVKADKKDNTLLISDQYDRTAKSPIFRGFNPCAALPPATGPR